jgi:hypothetical protein
LPTSEAVSIHLQIAERKASLDRKGDVGCENRWFWVLHLGSKGTAVTDFNNLKTNSWATMFWTANPCWLC